MNYYVLVSQKENDYCNWEYLSVLDGSLTLNAYGCSCFLLALSKRKEQKPRFCEPFLVGKTGDSAGSIVSAPSYQRMDPRKGESHQDSRRVAMEVEICQEVCNTKLSERKLGLKRDRPQVSSRYYAVCTMYICRQEEVTWWMYRRRKCKQGCSCR